jgi:ankyrin repeat protein
LESEITLHIEHSESELAMKINCAAYDGDSYRVKRLIRAGVDPNNTDYNGRSPLVWNIEV